MKLENVNAECSFNFRACVKALCPVQLSPGPSGGRTWQPTPVFLPGESHGQRGLVGYSPWGHKESDTTDHTCPVGGDEMPVSSAPSSLL